MQHGRLLPLLGVLLVGLVLGTGPAHADTKPLFDYREITLDNGLRIITLEDFSCPIVAVHLWYHVGSKDERPERQGFAHMFEHMMFRGTERLGPTDHFNFVRKNGGDCNAYTSFDQTVYVQTLPANQLEMVLWLEAERMGFLRIDQNAFDTERKVVEEERRVGLNRPYGTLYEKAFAEIFKVHPYGWTPIGKISHLRASPVQELRDFWTRYYVPNNATLVIVGAVKHEEAQKLAKRYLGWLPREADPPRVTVKEPVPAKARSITIQEESAPAPGVGIVWRTLSGKHADSVPLDLLSTILGGGESSRLYRDLVADNQLAVMTQAAVMSLEQEGFFGAAAVVSPSGGDTRKALDALKKQLARIRTEPVSERELLKAKNQALAALVTGNLTVVSKASLLGRAAVLEGDVSAVNRRVEQIRKATADDLLRVARTYLDPERSLTITVPGNALGSLLGQRSPELRKEMESKITATPETGTPPQARAGLRRPADFPATPPVADLSKSNVPVPESRHTLANGLKVIVVPNSEVPYLTMQLGLLPGAWTERKPGAASMALEMLTKGTARHSEKELADELETYAIALAGSGGMDTSSVSAGCLTEHAERALTLLAEVVQTPTFPETEFEKLRKQTRTSLAVTTANPSYKAGRELRQRLYGTHPYARSATGELEDVDALKVEDLRSWWKTNARPDQAVLIFAGDIDEAKAVKLAEQTLGKWTAAGPKPDVTLPAIPAASATHIHLVDQPNAVQSQIRVGQLGIKRDHPDYAAARVVSDYFGGAFTSRLNEVIRVKKGLTYGARGGNQFSRFAGQFEISTFSKTETTAQAVQAVFDELERLRKEPPTTKELEDTKSYTAGSFARDRETPQQVARELWTLEANGLPANFFERTLDKIAQTDAASCIRLARQTIDPTKVVVVVVGDASKLQKDLEKIAPVTVVKK